MLSPSIVWMGSIQSMKALIEKWQIPLEEDVLPVNAIQILTAAGPPAGRETLQILDFLASTITGANSLK